MYVHQTTKIVEGATLAYTLHDAAAWMNGTVVGDGATVWNRAMSLLDAEAGDLVLIDSFKKMDSWAKSKASAAVVPLDFPEGDRPLIRVPEPLKAYLQLIQKLRGERSGPRAIHATAIIDSSAKIGENASIGAYVVIGSATVLGDDCTILPGVCIGANCKLGQANTLHPGVVLYDNSILGNRVVIHAKSVIGADGYGYRIEAGHHIKVPQLGYVEIGDDVEIGASATIDRGTIGPTRIGAGTKIDNLVMIAHNCQIGRHNLIVSQVGIAGSTTTGDYVVLGGQVGIADHLHIGEQSMIGAQCGITQDIPAHSRMAGTPAVPVWQYLRTATHVKSLPELRRTVADLKKKLDLPRDAS